MAEALPILCLARNFPPAAGGGVIRIQKLVKYLPEFGIEPHVLAGRVLGVEDTELSDQLGPLSVERLGLALSARTHRALTSVGAGRVYRSWRTLAQLGDDGALDLAEWVVHGTRLGRQVGARAVLATSQPFSTVIAGAIIARRLSVPLVADLRDPWARAPGKAWPSPVHGALARRIESATLNQAARVVVVTDLMADLVAPACRDRIETIGNGFDPADFRGPVESRPPKVFRVVYSGSLYGTRRPDAWLDAMDRVRPLVERSGRSLELIFAGRAFGKETELESRGVEVRGYLPHSQSIALLRSADVAMVLIGVEPGDEHHASGKLYESIAAGPPVVAWAPRGGIVGRVLEASGAGWAAENVDELTARFQGVVSGERSVRPLDERDLTPWSRVETARRYAALLRDVSSVG